MSTENKTIISPEPDTLVAYLKTIYAHRAIILVLAKRSIYIKYAQTILGLMWTILQPLSAVLVYTILFSFLLDIKTAYPYILFVLSGVLFWGTFTHIFSHASNSLIENQDLLTKMYFPRIILPISKILVALFEFIVVFALFFLVSLYYKHYIFFEILLLIPLFVLTACFALGLALSLSALTIKRRDFNHIIPFLVNLGIWLTPVFYPVSIIPEKYIHFIYLNPMATVIQLFRCVIFDESFSLNMLIGIPVAFLSLLVGFFYFKQNEDILVEKL